MYLIGLKIKDNFGLKERWNFLLYVCFCYNVIYYGKY